MCKTVTRVNVASQETPTMTNTMCFTKKMLCLCLLVPGIAMAKDLTEHSELLPQAHTSADFGQLSTISQYGYGNDALIVQLGQYNTASINQHGLSNLAMVSQRGSQHEARILQGGGYLEASIIQNGKGHEAGITQQGYGKEAAITQHGIYGQASIQQLGNSHASPVAITQFSRGRASVQVIQH
jgi:hypothetical protein